MTGFGLANTKREGDIADPKEYTFECWCEECQKKYADWKQLFEEQQRRYEIGEKE